MAYSCTDGIATRSSNENAYYYIFNRGENNGFIIISGDDRAKSVLGYSDCGSFSAKVMPDNFKNWISLYQKELKALAAIDDATSTVQSSSILSATTKATSFSTSISPLLGTIAWNQLSPYNILCPKVGTSRAPTGCVATAMNLYVTDTIKMGYSILIGDGVVIPMVILNYQFLILIH